MEIASARTDIASPDGHTFLMASGYPHDSRTTARPRLSGLKLLRVAPDGDGTAHDEAICRELERRDRHREARSRRRAAPTGEPTFGVCEAVFEAEVPTTFGDDPDRASAPTTCLRGDDAAKWPEEHLTYRPDEECYHNPPMFLVGNCAVVYSGPTTRPAIRRTKFTVWRF